MARTAPAISWAREFAAETTPLRNPEFYPYEMNLADITEAWRRGSVISSRLLDLTASALQKDPDLESYSGRVSDSGEGRWTIQARYRLDLTVVSDVVDPQFSFMTLDRDASTSRSPATPIMTVTASSRRQPA